MTTEAANGVLGRANQTEGSGGVTRIDGKTDADPSTAKTDDQLRSNMWFLAQDRWRRSLWFSKSHDRAATLWRRMDVWLRWLLAILAALSGFSFLSENTGIGQGLAVATALLAATNAALGPGDRAGLHGKAAADYSRCESQADWLLRLDLLERESGGSKKVDELRAALESLEEQLAKATETAPPVRKWQRHDPKSAVFIGSQQWFTSDEQDPLRRWWRRGNPIHSDAPR